MIHLRNLLSDVDENAKFDEEKMELLYGAEGSGAPRIERIVSTGQSSAPDFWYDQEEDEFVLVLKGSAVLEFDDEEMAESVTLTAGDSLTIAAHQRHRVKSTSTDEPTVWLCVFIPR